MRPGPTPPGPMPEPGDRVWLAAVPEYDWNHGLVHPVLVLATAGDLVRTVDPATGHYCTAHRDSCWPSPQVLSEAVERTEALADADDQLWRYAR